MVVPPAGDNPVAAETQTETVSAEGVATGTAAATSIGAMSADVVEAVEVTIDGDVSDYEFNVSADGTYVFTGAQAPSATGVLTFTPDDAAKRVAQDGPVNLAFEVTTAGSGGTVDVAVEARTER